MATVENFEMTEIDLEQNNSIREHTDVAQNEAEMMNIGEFVFNHITAEAHGSLLKSIRRKVAIHSKVLIKSCTIIDISIYIWFLFLSLFLLVQKNTVVSLNLTWIVYWSLCATFVEGIVWIWLLKLIIEAGYEHKIYATYIIFRILSILLIFTLISVLSVQHLVEPPGGLSDTRRKILKYYMRTTLSFVGILTIYFLTSSAIYSLHLSVVKEFYKIVAIIVEAQNQYKKPRHEMEIAQGIPDICIGMPLYERVKQKTGINLNEDSLELSMKDAKFEVEIELQDNLSNDKSQNLSKIKMFQWDSESEGSDSFRVDLQKWVKMKEKNVSFKIPKGRRLTIDDEDELGMHRRPSHQGRMWSSTKKIDALKDDAIEEEEEDDDRYGLDFLEGYNENERRNKDKSFLTAFTGDEMVSSPISRMSQKKKISIKNVTRKFSTSNSVTKYESSTAIKERRITINEEQSPVKAN